jgi:dihydrofolate reductase
MRKINVLEFISLDGVIQAPGGAKEDTDGGFAFGAWTTPYRDAVSGAARMKQRAAPADVLLGRRTFENFQAFWPHHSDIWPGINTATKYVASNTLTSSDWKPTIFLNGDIANLHVWGSSQLVQTLLKHDLVDALWLKIFPVVLGNGKKLFGNGTIPAAFKVTESSVTPKGIIVINYERAGAVPLADFAA